MADYLNPDSMLQPMGANNTPLYAPSAWSIMTSDVKRQLQAEEALRHMNMMNEQDRRAKPWLTEAAISEAKMKSDRDLAMADPAMVEAWKQSQLGGFDKSIAEGKLAKGTVDSDINMKNTANTFGINQTKYLDEYNKLAKLYQPLQAMVNSGMDQKLIQDNIMRLFKQQGMDTDWVNPEYMQALQLLSKDPVKLMTVLDNQMGSLMNQAQRFDLTKQRESDLAAKERAEIAERGANSRATKAKEGDDNYKLYNAYTNNAKLYLQRAEKEEDVARIMTLMKQGNPSEHIERARQFRQEAIKAQNQANQLMGVAPVASEASAPAASTQNIIKLD